MIAALITYAKCFALNLAPIWLPNQLTRSAGSDRGSSSIRCYRYKCLPQGFSTATDTSVCHKDFQQKPTGAQKDTITSLKILKTWSTVSMMRYCMKTPLRKTSSAPVLMLSQCTVGFEGWIQMISLAKSSSQGNSLSIFLLSDYFS